LNKSKSLKEEYIVISISFEGIGDKVFCNEEEFSNVFIELLSDSLELSYKEESKRLNFLSNNIKNMKDLSKVITNFVKDAEKEVVLFVDEWIKVQIVNCF